MLYPKQKKFWKLNKSLLFYYWLDSEPFSGTPGMLLGYLFRCIIYLQSECIENYEVELYSKYDREHDFDVILE